MNFFDIDPGQALAVRKHAMPTLRKLGLKSADEFTPHTLEWPALNETCSAIMRAANELLTRAEGKNEAEATDMERAHAGLMAMYDSIVEERDARTQLGDRSPRANGGDVRRPNLGGNDAAQRKGGDSWRDLKSGREVRVLKPADSVETVVREEHGRDQFEGLGIGAFVRAAVLGPKSEPEKRVLAESLGTSGGYGVPEPLAARVIDSMRRQAVVIRAGANTVVMNSKTLGIARLDTDPVASWRAENAQINDSDPTFGLVNFNAKSLACLVKLSRELLEDAANIDQVVNNAIGQAMALEVDRAALVGAGALEPTGVLNLANKNTVDLGGDGLALSGYDNLLDAHYELDLDHVPEDGRVAIMHPRTRRDYSKIKDGEGLPLVKPDRVQGLPFLSSTSVPINDTQGQSTTASRIYLGYWPHLLIGMRTELQITILRERYADYGQFALLAWMRADVNAEHDQSFCDIKGVLPSS